MLGVMEKNVSLHILWLYPNLVCWFHDFDANFGDKWGDQILFTSTRIFMQASYVRGDRSLVVVGGYIRVHVKVCP